MRELTIVLNVMNGELGDTLERARNYVVKKNLNGSITANFQNNDFEEWRVKMTLTALKPNVKFEVLVSDTVTGYRSANSAGILECRFVVPANKILAVREMTE